MASCSAFRCRSNGLPYSYRMHCVSLFEPAKREHVFLIIHLAYSRLNTISLANTSAHPGGLVDRPPHFLPIKPFDDVVLAFNAQHFALDGFDALPHFLIAPHEVGKSALPIITGIMPRCPCCLRDIGDT